MRRSASGSSIAWVATNENIPVHRKYFGDWDSDLGKFTVNLRTYHATLFALNAASRRGKMQPSAFSGSCL